MGFFRMTMPGNKLLVIDNYDSFTYNLVQALGALGADIEVCRNDVLTIADIERMDPDRIVISPGPGRPEDAGLSVEVVRRFGSRPVLGVCLGHQCIGEAFGTHVERAEVIMHGKTSMVHHDGKGVFANLANPFEAMRYHSLVLIEDKLPPDIEVSARTARGVVMGIRHRSFKLEGVQFHPESFLTSEGTKLLSNFLKMQ